MARGFLLRNAAVLVSLGLLLAIMACSADSETPMLMVETPAPTIAVTPQHTATPMPTVTPTSQSANDLTATMQSPTSESVKTPTRSPSDSAVSTAPPQPTPTPLPTTSAAASPTPAPNPDTPTPTSIVQLTPTVFPETSYFLDSPDCDNLAFPNPLPTLTITLRYNDIRLQITAEHADDPSERSQGLMCRSVVPDQTGMLFEFSSESPQGFWMYNTYVPLDIIYLNGVKQAVGSAAMSPCPRPEGASDSAWQTKCINESEQYSAAHPAQYAIELPSGWLDKAGIPRERVNEVEFSW